MRLVQLVVPDDARRETFRTLDELGVDFVTVPEERREASVVSFPLPTGAVEEVFDRLDEAGFDPAEYTVGSLEGAQTPNFEAIEDRYTTGPDAESRVSHEELQTAAGELKPDRTTFLAQAVLSATVAVAGLLLDSAVVVVGSMVIAPFTGSSLSAALGAVMGDRSLLADNLRSQVVGLSTAVLTGAVVGGVARLSPAVPPNVAITSLGEVADFSSLNPLVLTVAVAAGSIGALGLATNQETALAGVAVSVAVVPSAAALGVGIAWTEPAVAVGALALLVTNVILIDVSSYVTFRLLGYRTSPTESDVGE